MNQTTYYTTMHSPIDELLLVSDGNALTVLSMDPTRNGSTVEAAWKRDPGPFREVVRQLLAYFEGELRQFDLPIRLQGTDFQQVVWAASGCCASASESAMANSPVASVARVRAARWASRTPGIPSGSSSLVTVSSARGVRFGDTAAGWVASNGFWSTRQVSWLIQRALERRESTHSWLDSIAAECPTLGVKLDAWSAPQKPVHLKWESLSKLCQGGPHEEATDQGRSGTTAPRGRARLGQGVDRLRRLSKDRRRRDDLLSLATATQPHRDRLCELEIGSATRGMP